MTHKNSNTVAVERRVDLASLFCMIGRHGPAVALAVIAMVSVLAGIIIYRTMRGKRRKAAAADSHGESCETERDASVIQPSPEESQGSVEATDMSDDGSSEVKVDADMIQSDLKIRHRRTAAAADATAAVAAAAEKKPPPYSPSNSGIQVPENKHTTSDDTEGMAVAGDSFKEAETYSEEVDQGLQSVAEMVVEDAFDRHQGATADIVEDVIEEARDNDSCLKEPEPSNDENHEEDEKVLKAEYQKDEDVATGKDVSDKKTSQEEENFESALNNPTCFEQTPHTGEKGDDDRPQDNTTTLERNSDHNSEEPVIQIEGVPAPCTCYGKDAEFEKDNPDSIDYSNYNYNRLSPEEEKRNDSERAEEECVGHLIIAQQAEIASSTFEQETNLPFTQRDQRESVTDTVIPPIRDSDWDDDHGLAGEVIEEVADENRLNKLTAVKFDTHSPQFEKQEAEIEQKEENGTCNEDDGADQVKEKMLIGDNIVGCREERDSSSVAPPCLSGPVNVDNHDDSLSVITTDAKAHISGIGDFPDLSSGCHPQKEDKMAPSLDENTNSTILTTTTILTNTQMLLHETENLPENNKNGRTVVLTEECNDQVCDTRVQSCYEDQQSAQMINKEVSDKESVAADPDTVQKVTASVIVEEISCPHLPSICQDQQSDHMENEEILDETRVNSATDAVACDNASLAALLISEEISHPDMLSSSQDQQSDHMENNEDLSEVTTGAAPVMTKDISHPMCQIYLPSFEQSERRDDDISSPGLGKESGISSMAVSPDLQDGGNEFDLTVGNMGLSVRDCDLQSKGQTEAQNNLIADDVAKSVINKDTAGMVFGPYPSSCTQAARSEHTDWTKYDSSANEDMFGHEIEDGYHRAIGQFRAQVAASVTSYTDDLKLQTDMKAVIEVLEVKEKTGISIEKKEDTKAEKEKEEDHEKTEISIMEATMDNNEWIMDSNYQVLPWLNLSAASFAQDHTKTNQVPTDECQHSSAVTDAIILDATDIPPSPEVKQTSSTSLIDENMENNKKVVAVQPMPQNVNVTFRIHYFTQSPYQIVAVTGNQQELGNWKRFIPLERAKDGHWATVVSLPAESHVEWKFVVVDKGEVRRWEECGNRLLDTGYGDDLLVHKWWGLL